MFNDMRKLNYAKTNNFYAMFESWCLGIIDRKGIVGVCV